MSQRLSHIDHRIWWPLTKFVCAALVGVLMAILIVNAIRNPSEESGREYTAEFADTSGLHPNSDVRIRGVRAGKVTAVELDQGPESTTSRVTFTLSDDHRITESSSAAVKYANLAGVRYLDVIDADADGREVGHLPADRTVPSFDITRLFNGLQPALETLGPEEVNEFTGNAVALLQGDGGGLEPMLDSVAKLSRYAADRERVIVTLADNMAAISDSLGGRSPQIIEILRELERPVVASLSVLDEIPKAATYGPQFMGAVSDILIGLGLQPTTDFDALISESFGSVDDMLRSFQLLPTLARGLKQLSASEEAGSRCSKGTLDLPALQNLMLNESGVVLCRAN
ncbi:MCE family protein [Gordonia sp. zg691]|uniref:MCE family protein n=1 Tax=Gordonia jinghuaiqii TaxID=2758710 RepID=A0A7D7LQS8_9ACTN|nr:MlaD family protein [Gordonia jinghuaiqii]MBD0863514.1 MCE family protein [Gordonia jinghuaiqii]MCR5979250.1 MCE family protein [Gordonia jinghuaiqii]QMT01040.1 MCE family protein [Gordonia jinghuaiqii]